MLLAASSPCCNPTQSGETTEPGRAPEGDSGLGLRSRVEAPLCADGNLLRPPHTELPEGVARPLDNNGKGSHHRESVPGFGRWDSPGQTQRSCSHRLRGGAPGHAGIHPSPTLHAMAASPRALHTTGLCPLYHLRIRATPGDWKDNGPG